MLWDLYQQMRIEDVSSSVRQSQDEAAIVRRELLELRRAVDTLTLTCAAMWELLQQHGNVTDQQLVAKIQEIDLRDGVLDGKMSKPAAKCSACGRVNNATRSRCMYCGQGLPVQAAI